MNGEFIGKENFDIDVNPSEEFLIGAGGNERPVHTYLFQGKIDEVRLYDRVLDEDEIAAVMESDSLAVEAVDKLAITWGDLKAK